MQPEVVILGGTGFIGSAVGKAFALAGCERVRLHSSRTLDLRSQKAADHLIEILNEETVLVVAIRSAGFDPLSSFWTDIQLSMTIHYALTKRRIRKCVYFSSTGVYGDSETNFNIDENTPIAPSSLYGLSKFVGESLIRQALVQSRSECLILRPCMVYGPGDTSRSYGPRQLMKQLLEDKTIRLFGDGGDLREYLFIDDLANITVRLSLGRFFGVYNLVTGYSSSFEDLVKHLQSISADRLRIVHEQRGKPYVHQRCDPRKLLDAIGPFQFTSVAEGLASAYRDLVGRTAMPAKMELRSPRI